jgi:membrane protease subunit HflC
MNRPVLAMVAGILLLAAVLVALSSLYTVHTTQQALVIRLGSPNRVVKDAGLHFKWPLFFESVQYYDNRVLDYAPPTEEVIAADQKRLVVDSFSRFRIVDPLLFYQAVQSEQGARGRLSGAILSSLRRVIGSRTLTSVLSEERAEIMRLIRDDVNQAATPWGIDVIDVRIRRADLPQQNAEAIYQRMQSEREREAREFRAQGAELAQRIRSRAERERTVLIAEAERQAQIARGEGDAEATRVYAEGFGRDPEFFSFYRSMQAYRESLGGDGTTMVLSPTSDFFRYFGSQTGVGQPQPPAAQPDAAAGR